ncbi:collagen, type I, alpha 1a-like [Delphinus delphis]|uniref:collagen, type I, alpha 1a-like n=1 Tax=Delphinus delphis TaxID=9728 RepID=UPI0028C39457|nr:uncharacterized protein LOC132437155 [Delphinus delphis]
MQRQETRFPGCPVGVAVPRPPRSSRPGTGGVSSLPWDSGARTSPGLPPLAFRAAVGWGGARCAAVPRPGGGVGRRAGKGGPAWRPGAFFHKGRAAETAASEQPEEEADEKMPLSLPPQGDHGESSPSRTPKKHASFHIWRSKKKQQPPRSDCGVFIPHPPPASFGEASPAHNHQKRTKGNQFWENSALCSRQEGEGTPETG